MPIRRSPRLTRLVKGLFLLLKVRIMNEPHPSTSYKKYSAVSFIFVIDPPALTLQSILIAASVRRHLPEIDLIAYCPSEKADSLPPQLIEYFQATNTRLEYMNTEGTFSRPYKQGNKLLAAAKSRPHDFTVFLDTDVVVWQPFDVNSMVSDNTVTAVPEGRYTWGKPAGHWDQAYSVFGMTTPDERIRLARTNVPSPPYFNAGVVGFPNGFGEIWLDTAKVLDEPDNDIPQRRPWLDQIAMPIAIRRAGMAYRLLDDRYNLALTHKKHSPDMGTHMAAKVQKVIDHLNSFDPFILHYHAFEAPKGLRYEGYLDDLFREWTIFDRIEDAHWKQQLNFNPSKIMAEFGQLKRVPPKERTEDQQKRFREVDKMKRELKRMKNNPFSFAEYWPSSILREREGDLDLAVGS